MLSNQQATSLAFQDVRPHLHNEEPHDSEHHAHRADGPVNEKSGTDQRDLQSKIEPECPRATLHESDEEVHQNHHGDKHPVEGGPQFTVVDFQDHGEAVGVQSGSGVIITGSVVTAGEARAMFGKDPE